MADAWTVSGDVLKGATPFMIASIVALVKYAWYDQRKRIEKLEEFIDKDLEKRVNALEILKESVMTFKDHQDFCKEVKDNQITSLNSMVNGLKMWLDAKFQAVDFKIESEVLKEIKRLNGNKS